MLPYLFIILGIVSRLLPHPPNFTPITAIALFGGAHLDKKQASIIPLIIMVLSDFFIGLHQLIGWTWGSFLMISILGFWLKKHRKISDLAGITFLSSVLFFVITNFGVWISTSWYPHTIDGLITCYLTAIPFFRNTLLGDFLYVGVFFGLYELVKRSIEKSSWSFIKTNK